MPSTHPLPTCPSCELEPFTRNHYFTGKLLVERDFTDEQRYYVDKLRHHHQRLHGRGVVCGLRVKQHPNPACRDRFICIEPGTAIDCCGREIVLHDEDCLDLTTFEAIRALQEEEEPGGRTLQITICYRECPTEEIPVLYDECGCDNTQCAPNRVLESYRFDVQLVDPAANVPPEPLDVFPARCDEILDTLATCPECEEPDCLVLATVADYGPGQQLTDARIDNLSHRPLLPSTNRIVEVIRCLLEREEGDGGPGEPGPPGPGIDDVQATFVDCEGPGSAAIQVIGGVRTLVLEVPRGCDGADGADGADGRDGVDGADGADGQPGSDGADGVGLEPGLVRISALSWTHRARNGRFIPLLRPNGSPFTDPRASALPLFGLVIGFTDEVRVYEAPRPVNQLFQPQLDPRPITDADHVFQVLAEHATPDQRLGLRCRCPLIADVVPVDFQVDASGERIIGARARMDTPELLAASAPGIAWVLDQRRTPLQLLRELLHECWVVLRGDFVVDTRGRAVDAEFARAQLPTGDRPVTSDFGVQGGVFESWFEIDREQPVAPLVDVNSASVADLARLPGIGRATIDRIEAERAVRPFGSVEDFRARARVPETTWEKLRDFITVRPGEV